MSREEVLFSMKSTGIVRRIDDTGRLVLPIEIRKVLQLNTRDSVEIFTEDDKIILKKFAVSCVFCGKSGEVVRYRDKLICKDCCEVLKREL